MSTLVCFALKEEAAPFRKVVAGRTTVATLIVGIGRQSAEKSIRKFLADEAGVLASPSPDHLPAPARLAGTLAPPSLVLTCGFAGGLNPDLKIGDVVFEIRQPPAAIHKSLLAAGAKPAKFFCADRIATTGAEKRALREQTSADVVEMESAAIHAVCGEMGIPCVTVRVISDTANEDLPLDFNALSKPDKSLDFGKLAWAIARSPGKIGALMALQKKTSFAASQLAEVLNKVVFP
jgi:hypothetical protein